MQGENKTKNNNNKNPLAHTPNVLLVSRLESSWLLSPETIFTYSEIIAWKSQSATVWGGGEGGEVGGMWARATLTVPGRMSPAGQRSGPPSHSPPVAAQLDHSLGTAW